MVTRRSRARTSTATMPSPPSDADARLGEIDHLQQACIRARVALGVERFAALTGLPVAFWQRLRQTLPDSTAAAAIDEVLDARFTELGHAELAARSGLSVRAIEDWIDAADEADPPVAPDALIRVMQTASVLATHV